MNINNISGLFQCIITIFTQSVFFFQNVDVASTILAAVFSIELKLTFNSIFPIVNKDMFFYSQNACEPLLFNAQQTVVESVCKPLCFLIMPHSKFRQISLCLPGSNNSSRYVSILLILISYSFLQIFKFPTLGGYHLIIISVLQ